MSKLNKIAKGFQSLSTEAQIVIGAKMAGASPKIKHQLHDNIVAGITQGTVTDIEIAHRAGNALTVDGIVDCVTQEEWGQLSAFGVTREEYRGAVEKAFSES